MEKVEKLKRMEAKRIPETLITKRLTAWLQKQNKTTKIQPETIAQASRISGVNPLTLAF